MRQIINISLPEEMAKNIKDEARKRGFSVSELIRAAIRLYNEERLLRIIKKGRKEHREGKTITLNSIRDLK